MSERRQQISRIGRRGSGCIPFLVVAVCFFLPFFSLSGCGSGQHTRVTGLDIVTGSTPIRQQDSQPLFGPTQQLSPIGPDKRALTASRAARPWAICLLVLVTVGAIAGLLVHEHRRAALGTIAALSFVALWSLLASASGEPSPDDFKLEGGAIVAFLTLIATTIWHVGEALAAHKPERPG